ncbi:hypothetical protein [Streptomyces sp. NPDC017940]|uniref:hypothetical protein n=1 Tax=Streptomyces sp. NPDC017940 TaxID=3365017 RepID=UPI0037B28BF2
MPAGKAIAIAAMPTAVLMGMGLTPQLAQAKPGLPKNPFRDGPCVTAPDEQSKTREEAEQDAKDRAAKKAEEKAEAARERADEAEKKAKKKAEGAEDSADSADSAGSDGSGTSEDSEGSESSEDAGGSRSEPSSRGTSGDSGKNEDVRNAQGDKDAKADEDSARSPAPARTRNPLDPLGVGDAIKDVLTPDGKESARSGASKSEGDRDGEADSPKDSSDSKDSSGSADSQDSKDSDDSDDSKNKVTDKVTKPVDGTLGKMRDGLKGTADDATDKALDKAEEAAEKAERAAEQAKDEADPDAGTEASADSDDPMAPDEDGKKPFPCVVEKKVDGDDEQSPAPIPNQPWHLEASSLLLKGADYKGVVNLRMPDGRTKQALKYIISGGTDIGDLHQIVDGPGGKKYHVEAAKGSMSTIRNGDTTMYTERISGNLFGLIPITFDPEHPPPLNLPLIYFTNVKVQQAGQFGGDLTIPGLHQSITD